MRSSILLRPLAGSTLLFAAACGGSGATVEAGNETAMNVELANVDEALPESVNQTGAGVDPVSLPPADRNGRRRDRRDDANGNSQ